MIKKYILVSLLVLSTLSLASVANQKEKNSALDEKSVYAKCYVEIVGGGETIGFWLVKPSELKALTRNIVGKEILLVMNAQKTGNNKKVIIYKAIQCVLEEGEFSSSRARTLDKKYES
jgi:hypothetical protein